ncbi:MAG: hypothetical protein M0Q87_06425 [Ottowia sp.]|nr:hypothetical protein [Ottowia sp.]
MATESTPRRRGRVGLKTAVPAVAGQVPANRRYVFAKNCVNDFGSFVIGDAARGAFPADLVAAYLVAGVLVERPHG